jgi:dihydroorotate dehydrogenase
VDDTKPLFVKVAPDLEFSALDEVVSVAKEHHLTGIIATNTTISRDGVPEDRAQREEAGGLSGRPLWNLSNNVLNHLYQTCGQDMILIGVGGIFTGQDLYDKIASGAHLCQVYTGWVYGGPQMAPGCLEELEQLLERDGIKSLSDLRGTAKH